MDRPSPRSGDALLVSRVPPPEGCPRCSCRGCWRRALVGRRCVGCHRAWHGRREPVRGWPGCERSGGYRRHRSGDVGGDRFRDDESPARVDPVGVGERSATGLGYADVGLVDGLPLLAVAVIRDGDAPQGVTRRHGVGHRGGLSVYRWSGVGHELHRGSNSSACDAGRCGGGVARAAGRRRRG